MQSQYIFKKLETAIFYLLIFAVPVQARVILHSWTQPFNQWTSAYLYGTDILLAMILILWLRRNLRVAKITDFKFIVPKQFTNPKSQVLKLTSFWVTVFFIISAFSIFNSRIIGLSFYQLLKLAEFIGFYFYLKSSLGKIFSFRSVTITIIASGLFQSIIAIAQYIKQGNLGLRLLGESPLSVNSEGVAVFIADGDKYLRVYGTTPHPNILAAWLFVAIFTFYYWFLYYRVSRGQWSSYAAELIIYSILLFGLFFTFSRVIVGLWVLGVLARLAIVFLKIEFRQNKILKRRMLTLFVVSVLVSAVFSAIYWPQVGSRIHISAQEEATTQRIYYNKIAGFVAISHPLFGVGIGQFVPSFMSKLKYLPSMVYQPVHNIYLLIVSETGFLGLGAFLTFLFFSFWQFARRADFKKLSSFSFFIFSFSFLLVGLFDHFLWTSQQGSLIFWMMLTLLNMDF